MQSSENYKKMRIQKARIGQIEELIRIAKAQAKLKDSELRTQFSI